MRQPPRYKMMSSAHRPAQSGFVFEAEEADAAACARWALSLGEESRDAYRAAVGGTSASVEKSPGCAWRTFVWFVVPTLICLVLVPVGMDVVPSWSAKLGNGVRGGFTAQSCERGGGAGCYWVGYFVSDDGTDVRDGVGVDGDSEITAVGQQIPAIDTGDRVNVFPADGGSGWALTTFFAVLLLVVLGVWIVKVPVAAIRRRSTTRDFVRGPQDAAPSAKPPALSLLRRLLWGPDHDEMHDRDTV